VLDSPRMVFGTLRGGDGFRSAFIVALLLVSLFTTGLLAVQGHYAATLHRSAAERVLRDYARLAADEVVRRAVVEVDYYGYQPLLAALARRAVAPAGIQETTLEALAADPDERVRRAAELARVLFIWDGRSVRFLGPAPGGAVVEALAKHLATPDASRAPTSEETGLRFVHVVVGGDGSKESHDFAFSRLDDGRLVGFEARLEVVGKRIARVLERGPLLPPSLGHGEVGNDALFVRVLDPAGAERLRSGSLVPNVLPARAPFADAYGGVMEGWTVETAIDPAAAPRLVIGGLPPSRLPMLVGLLALTTALLVAAIVLLRRERALGRLRAEFVSSVSHELRTPLSEIRLFAETLLLGRVRSAEERDRSLAIIDKEARRLSHLVENVLQFSRGERGGLSVALEERALAPLVREVLDDFAPLCAGTGTRLEAALEDGTRAAVDASALRQVLLNLLDNATKYGPREQVVRVCLESSGGMVKITVEDQGPGVPPPERKVIFQRFRRLERDRRSSVAGAGIGLAVVRELVESHGGRTRVEEAAGGGARFVVELKAANREGAEAAAVLPHAP
jgi:signal transduction histidine kinase